MDSLINLLSGVKLVFDFIVSILSTIIDGIYGIVNIIRSLGTLFYKVFRIIPEPLFAMLFYYISLYLSILIVKLFRKG